MIPRQRKGNFFYLSADVEDGFVAGVDPELLHLQGRSGTLSGQGIENCLILVVSFNQICRFLVIL